MASPTDELDDEDEITVPILTAEQVKELMRQGARGAAELHANLKQWQLAGWARSRNLVLR